MTVKLNAEGRRLKVELEDSLVESLRNGDTFRQWNMMDSLKALHRGK